MSESLYLCICEYKTNLTDYFENVHISRPSPKTHPPSSRKPKSAPPSPTPSSLNPTYHLHTTMPNPPPPIHETLAITKRLLRDTENQIHQKLDELLENPARIASSGLRSEELDMLRGEKRIYEDEITEMEHDLEKSGEGEGESTAQERKKGKRVRFVSPGDEGCLPGKEKRKKIRRDDDDGGNGDGTEPMDLDVNETETQNRTRAIRSFTQYFSPEAKRAMEDKANAKANARNEHQETNHPAKHPAKIKKETKHPPKTKHENEILSDRIEEDEEISWQTQIWMCCRCGGGNPVGWVECGRVVRKGGGDVEGQAECGHRRSFCGGCRSVVRCRGPEDNENEGEMGGGGLAK